MCDPAKPRTQYLGVRGDFFEKIAEAKNPRD